ncbi:M16 family metallopeptidase [Faecalitalea cylindroides]|uniref:M16 family metallopeptidase n=1 Tax=Faecalitalea cylindroides TaxID=39483 RepID=UPI00232AC07F|nr:insulinase family protein [Faecalitalea cylindroides]MDB7952785.1 insulinase family protein [Faecalitalea cylindroides]MDB7959458.1 insulinase family protein [Faecalitalea cylindroides]MDB7961270.1 insulinase family protein [Faecalitalea cylindroides]MDB7963292.1 insulinase family protein [Faecalitalea cylindroides]MDB7965231.1 insulinase family protein [Faecalitalea cylindroides]
MNYISSNKFSDVSVAIRTQLPLERSTITAYNILVYMLKTKTELFKTKQALISNLNEAYGMKLACGLSSYGADLILTTRIQYIRSDWIEEEDYIHKVKEITDQVLFHSVLDEASFEEAKYLYRNKLTRILDDPDGLAIYTCLTTLNTNHEISIPIQGSLDDLDQLTLQDIQNVYSAYLKADKHIFVCGCLDEEMKTYLERMDSSSKLNSTRSLLPILDYQEEIIDKNISQSSIALVYATSTDILSEDYYKMFVMNSLLGQSPTSLLFEEVREKHSLCYSISSYLIQFDGALIITLGTNKENIEKAIDLINQQIQRIIDLDFDPELLNTAKKDCIDSLIVAQDYPFSQIDQRFMDVLLSRDTDRDKKIKNIQKVSLEDVSAAAKKLKKISSVIVKEVE